MREGRRVSAQHETETADPPRPKISELVARPKRNRSEDLRLRDRVRHADRHD